jgi:hypothetical protein
MFKICDAKGWGLNKVRRIKCSLCSSDAAGNRRIGWAS